MDDRCKDGDLPIPNAALPGENSHTEGLQTLVIIRNAVCRADGMVYTLFFNVFKFGKSFFFGIHLGGDTIQYQHLLQFMVNGHLLAAEDSTTAESMPLAQTRDTLERP